MTAEQPTFDPAANVRARVSSWTPQPAGADSFTFPELAPTPDGPSRMRGYGGLHLARGLTAAAQTVTELRPHALHALFLGRVGPEGPLTYAVERIRDGRSFATRRTRVLLGDQLLVEVTVSFTRATGRLAYREAPPQVAEPETLTGSRPWAAGIPPALQAELDATRTAFERVAYRSTGERDPLPALDLWVRPVASLPPAPLDQAAYLAYVSDTGSLPVVLQHLSPPLPNAQATSLDHTLHWHQLPLAQPDDWLLFHRTSPVAAAGRALLSGAFYAQDGTRVASVLQELLVLDAPRTAP